MIRSRNPRLDPAALEARIAAALAAEPPAGSDERLARLAAAVHVRMIESALDRAEERSAPRTVWPAEIDRFPFTKNPSLQRFVLRLMALVFRDQHDVNGQLIHANRETLSLVHGLLDRIESLELRLESARAAARAERIARRRDDI